MTLPRLDRRREAFYHRTHLHYVDRRGVHFVARPSRTRPARAPAWDLPETFHVLTASNPRSAPRPPRENAGANEALAARLRGLGAAFAPILGTSPDGAWRERSFAVWGVSAARVAALARALGQHATFVVRHGRRALGAGVCRPSARATWLRVAPVVTVEDAIVLAADRHRGQRDRAGEPYVLHPLRVAARLARERERLVALLHDLLEDTETTPRELRERGTPRAVLEAVVTLTRADGESYDALVARVARHPLARAVKLADIADNLDPTRLARLPAAERRRLRAKYRRARRTLAAVRGRRAFA